MRGPNGAQAAIAVRRRLYVRLAFHEILRLVPRHAIAAVVCG